MSFDTVTFWLFFGLVWWGWRTLPFATAKTMALGASLVFYGWWNPLYLPLLLFSAAVDHGVARAIHASDDPARRRAWLLVSLTANLGLLAIFKYTPFAVENGRALAGVFGVSFDADTAGWVVPVGISFYTFQTLSYTLDVHAGRIEPTRSFRDLFLYVAFFPQLVAGPIVRARELLPQLARRRPLRAAAVHSGLELVITGLFLKVVVADNLGRAIAPVFDAVGAREASPAQAWMAAASFSARIFADFAGYSGIAIGLALLMGLRFPRNFDWPYLARGPSEFWQRWHITLSTWLRDYLYIPLGGDRDGRARALRNVILVMLLGGLWHGAAWTFVLWGLVHGVALAAERVLRGSGRPRRSDDPPGSLAEVCGRVAAIVAFQLFIVSTWVLFASPDLATAGTVLERMWLAPFREGLGAADALALRHLVLVGVVVAMHLGALAAEWRIVHASPVRRAVIVGLWLALLVVVDRGTPEEFIYFQF